MAKDVVVIGSGVIGLTVAYYLKKLDPSVNVTIVSREMPRKEDDEGDDWTSGQWASPWAGAIYAVSFGGDKQRRMYEIESYRHFWRLGHSDVATGIQLRPIRQYWDDTITVDEAARKWMRQNLLGWRLLRDDELPGDHHDIIGGFEFQGMCVNPWVYLPWLRSRLEEQGVSFVQRALTSVSDAIAASGFSAPVVVNATGLGAKEIAGVDDHSVQPVRGQTMWVRLDWSGAAHLREGREYTYVIPRAYSGGTIFGGISEPHNSNPEPEDATKVKILRNVSALQPAAVAAARNIPDSPGEIPRGFGGLRVIKHIVGFRPGRKGGVRVNRDVVDSTPVHHCYGFEGSGYIYSAGIGKHVALNVLSDLLDPARSKL